MTTLRSSAQNEERPADHVKVVLDIDLNSPSVESLLDGASSSVHHRVISLPPGPTNLRIDLDDTEDDVQLISSSSEFPQIVRPRRNTPVTVVLDDHVDTSSRQSGGTQEDTTLSLSSKRRHNSNIPIINCEQYLDIEEECDAKRKKSTKTPSLEPPKEVPKPPPLPPPPSLICPICMNKLSKASSTTCGHIFCHDCIKAAVKAHKKCPNCRKKLSMNSFHRVYLPNTD